jgi:peptidoglycan/LPS O-acetylase OafA/YrhL
MRPLQPLRLLVWLGDASYAIYLFQPLATHFAMTWLPDGGGREGAVFVALAFGGGIALHLAIERPLLRGARPLMERCFGVRRSPETAAAVT